MQPPSLRAPRQPLLAGLCLLLCLGPGSPASAQVETVSGNFSRWTTATDTWLAVAFEDYYALDYFGTGCIASGVVELDLGGDRTLTLSLVDTPEDPAGSPPSPAGAKGNETVCPIYDGTSTPGIGADGSIPEGRSLLLDFDPPVHGFYAQYGSLAVGKIITLTLSDADGADIQLNGPPSLNGSQGSGFGFVSEQPITRVAIHSDEAGTVLMGYFIGLVAISQGILTPAATSCSNADCDFAVAYGLHRPVAFVTPTTGTGNLSTFPDASGNGAFAGDAVCRYCAAQSGQPDPDRFIAFLGYSTPAYVQGPLCRVVGYGGTYPNTQCTNPLNPHPASGSRWWRIDGLPWAAPMESGGGIGWPRRPLLDANGARVSGTYYTGYYGGSVSITIDSCSDWFGTSSSATHGNPNAVNFNWIDANLTSCNTPHHLLCVEVALGLPLPEEHASGRLVFVSVAAGSGDIRSWPEADAQAVSGIAAADSICVSEADAAGLAEPASFRAWLSGDGGNAIDRLTLPGAYVRSDGITVARSPADLVEGLIETGIDHHADGSAANSAWAWTGTTADGSAAINHCNNWESASPSSTGQTGSAGFANARWTDLTDLSCSGSHHLYCFSDAVEPPLFANGFE